MHIPKICVDRNEIRKALFPTEHGPIIRSRLQNDFYCYSMGALFQRFYPDVNVTYGLTNRTKSIRLADEICEEDLRRELDHCIGLRYTKDEVAFMGKIRNDGAFMFSDEYLEHLKDSTLPPYELSAQEGQFNLTTSGLWPTAVDWEIYQLTIISALRTDALMRKKTPTERAEVVEYTARTLEDTINLLREYPLATFSCFGTRRAGSPQLQYIANRSYMEYLRRGQFLGTSNVLFAKDLQTMPMGTNAHQMYQVVAALSNNDEELRNSQIKILEQWWQMYGWPLSIGLPDTFGSNWVFKHLPRKFGDWKGQRQDSMDPFKFGEKLIRFYEERERDPRDKLLIASDGLTAKKMIDITYHFQNRIKANSGFGTQSTNNTGLGHPSIVVKAMFANGRPCVKLSDNLAKAIGPRDEIERYTRVFDYNATDNIVPEC